MAEPTSPVDWSKLTPHEIASALRTIPRRVAYAWRLDGDVWMRCDADEYGCAWAATVSQREDGSWRGPPTIFTEEHPGGGSSCHTQDKVSYPTAEAAKTAYDAWLRARGWLIDETDDGSGGAPDGRSMRSIVVNGEEVPVTQGTFEDGGRVWWERR